MNPIIVITFISGFVIGMVMAIIMVVKAAARVVADSESGVFKIDVKDPEKDRYLIVLDSYFTLGDLKKKKWLLFKVDPDADLSETQK